VRVVCDDVLPGMLSIGEEDEKQDAKDRRQHLYLIFCLFYHHKPHKVLISNATRRTQNLAPPRPSEACVPSKLLVLLHANIVRNL
jgi:hypothetical protein